MALCRLFMPHASKNPEMRMRVKLHKNFKQLSFHHSMKKKIFFIAQIVQMAIADERTVFHDIHEKIPHGI
jgi:hypothetical protein